MIAMAQPDLERGLAQAQRELSEAREQQAATAEVLRIISRSPEDLRPVFETILANATRLCQAEFGNLDLRVGDGFRIAALHNAPRAYIEWRERQPVVRRKSFSKCSARSHRQNQSCATYSRSHSGPSLYRACSSAL